MLAADAVRFCGRIGSDIPAYPMLQPAAEATMRQACTAAGIDPDGAIVGIPEAAF